jgi:ATP/maltotriose-dependent transcriptional regulator MalT
MIYEVNYVSTPDGADIIEASARLGEEVRLRGCVPITMLHVDDDALVSTDRSAQAALLIRAPAILTMLAEWFDMLWSDPTTMAPAGEAGPTLTETQHRVLELMTVEGDEAIARWLKISITTVRRHVKTIYTTLGVDNRFAAGIAAAKRH